jgi:hypothetical protein
MPFKGYREISRSTDWGSESNPTLEQINAGSMLRIADAMEKMTQSFDALRADRDYWRGRAEDWECKANRLSRSIAALRGYITRLKRKI